VKFSAHPSILLNNKECSPLGVNKGVNFNPRGQSSPLGAKFTPWSEVIPWGPGVKLRMALWGLPSGQQKEMSENVYRHGRKGMPQNIVHVFKKKKLNIKSKIFFVG
jgi:hypothetical protein